MNFSLKITVWNILLGVLTALALFYFLTRKKKLGKSRKKYKSLLIAIFLAGVVGIGVYAIFLSKPNTDTSAGRASEKMLMRFGSDFPMVKFPSTGSDNTPLSLEKSLESLYANPKDGVITLFLLVLILGLSVATLKNIRERKGAEKDLENAKIAALNVFEDLQIEKGKLAEAKAKDEALLESIGEGMIATDQEDKIIIVNKMAETLLGFTSQELVGKPFVQAIPFVVTQGNRVLDTEQPIALSLSGALAYYFVRKNGTKFPVAVTATPVLLNAKPTGTIVVFRDITKETEIEKLRNDFLALASHQLRTPLSGTKWLIETIQREVIGQLNPKQKKYIDKLYQVNERMIKLVSDMLSVLLLEGGTLVTKKEEVSVSKVYEEVLFIMEPASQGKGVTLRSEFKNHQASVIQSDVQTIRNILESFVSNAISYSEDGQEVVLDTKEESVDMVFSIQDNGIGIPKKEQKRIFERFYRSSNAKEFKPDGTGLGLYLASLLAEKIGAKISFESEEGEGTTFYLRIPKI